LDGAIGKVAIAEVTSIEVAKYALSIAPFLEQQYREIILNAFYSVTASDLRA
jgi:hypothetical protein